MTLAPRKQPPTVRLRRLAHELRALRSVAGLTRDEVAAKTSMNTATLWRIESAKVRAQRRTILALMDIYGVTDEERRAELLDLGKEADQLGWLKQYEDELPEEYTAYISFEAEAKSVRNYESLFVPGLLQTEAYARRVVKGVLPTATPEEVERRVEARMQRQASIKKENPVRLWAILDEAVIRRQVGGAEVMAAQLQALAEAAELPHLTLQVIPFERGEHAGMPGSFVVMDFPDPADPALVYIDSMAGDLFLEKAVDVKRYGETFQHLQAVALDPASSIVLIQEASNYQ